MTMPHGFIDPRRPYHDRRIETGLSQNPIRARRHLHDHGATVAPSPILKV